MKKKFLYFCLLLTGAVSCTDYLHPEYVDVVSLGATVKSNTLSRDANSSMFRMTSNVDFDAIIVQGSEWLRFEGNDGNRLHCPASTRTIRLRATANLGFPRMGLVTLEAGGRADTLYVKQEGTLQPFVLLRETSLTASPDGGTYSFLVETNLPKRDIQTFIDIEGIESARYEENLLTVVVSPNDGRNDRTFHLDIFCITQWRDKIGSTLTISQKKIQ